MTLKLAILLSGRGSNMQAIHRNIQAKRLDAQIAVVLSDKADAPGLAFAQAEGLLTRLVAKAKEEGREAYDQRLIAALDQEKPDLVVLAGFMRLLSPAFIRHFQHRIVNIHPSLLPAFPGLHAQRQALEAGVRYSGCTVHFVDEGCDTGPIIDQRVVAVLPEDDEESLAERILEQEHLLYSSCLQKLAEGKVRIAGKKVIVE
ncbi:MAG: phosphoribosylglycinamide formyltransferase [bacterium]